MNRNPQADPVSQTIPIVWMHHAWRVEVDPQPALEGGDGSKPDAFQSARFTAGKADDDALDLWLAAPGSFSLRLTPQKRLRVPPGFGLRQPSAAFERSAHDPSCLKVPADWRTLTLRFLRSQRPPSTDPNP